MKHGERLYARIWWKKHVTFRYRVDPVPFIRSGKRSYFKCWYKTPKTANERRQCYGNEKYIRGRRRPLQLPNAWDDYPRADSFIKRSWKKNSKCKKQWMKNR